MNGQEAYDAVKHALEVSYVLSVPRYPFIQCDTDRLSSHRKSSYLYCTSGHLTTVGLSGVVLQRTRLWAGDP